MDSGSSESDEGQHELKIVILGNSAVGKTSLIKQYCEREFTQVYKPTVGLDFYSKRVELPGGSHPMLRIWDVGGKQTGGSMIENYIHGADAVCFVYDVTDSDSLNDMEHWYSCVRTYCDQRRDDRRSPPFMVLVGNKIDLPNPLVSNAMHERAAALHNMDAFLISARSGMRINALFTKIAAKLCGVGVTQQELNMRDRVVANVESRPEERVSVFHSTSGDRRAESEKKDCRVM